MQLQKLCSRNFRAAAIFFVIQSDIEKSHAVAKAVGIDVEADFIAGRSLHGFFATAGLVAGGTVAVHCRPGQGADCL